MAVYLFTIHSYASWLQDNPRGYTEKGKGVQPPSKELGDLVRRSLAHEPVIFNQQMQELLVSATVNLCEEKNWRLHQIRATTTHIHILVSWRGFVEWKEVRSTLKRRLGADLSKALNKRGPWFSLEGSRKQVKDRKHFDHLMETYCRNIKARFIANRMASRHRYNSPRIFIRGSNTAMRWATAIAVAEGHGV